MAVVGGGFVVAFGFGVVVAVKGMRQWIAGRSFPARIQLLEWDAVAVGFVILSLVDAGLGWTIVAGLTGGLLTANLWGIRIARANRGAVDQALSALETSAVRTKPTPSATRVEPLTPILRNTCFPSDGARSHG